jgi:phosphonate transport system substrate-binding protein
MVYGRRPANTRTKTGRIIGLLVAALIMHSAALASEEPLSFNVLNHRGVTLTAHYWNPILTYISQKTGVPLELRLNKTSKENTAIAETGVYHFLYTNHFFTPERDKLGYRVIARPAGPDIRSQLVVRKDSPVHSIKDLAGTEVAFPTPDGFTGYWLPMDFLLRTGIKVKPVFTGSQEASYGYLRDHRVVAAGVNSVALENYARRTDFQYRVLWTSDPYKELCIMANPKVPKEKVAAVQAAFVGMAKDPEGRKILQAGAQLIKQSGELGFVAADNREYDNYRAFYRNTPLNDHSTRH